MVIKTNHKIAIPVPVPGTRYYVILAGTIIPAYVPGNRHDEPLPCQELLRTTVPGTGNRALLYTCSVFRIIPVVAVSIPGASRLPVASSNILVAITVCPAPLVIF